MADHNNRCLPLLPDGWRIMSLCEDGPEDWNCILHKNGTVGVSGFGCYPESAVNDAIAMINRRREEGR